MAENVKKKNHTRTLIKISFMELYNNKNYININVNEICDMINIHRSSFYRYFENIDTLLREIEDELLEEMYQISEPFRDISWPEDNSGRIAHLKIIDNLFRYFSMNKTFMIPLLSPYGDPYFKKKFTSLIKDSLQDLMKTKSYETTNYYKYCMSYIAGGLIAATYQWLNDGAEVNDMTTKIFVDIVFSKPDIIL